MLKKPSIVGLATRTAMVEEGGGRGDRVLTAGLSVVCRGAINGPCVAARRRLVGSWDRSWGRGAAARGATHPHGTCTTGEEEGEGWARPIHT